MVPFSGLLSLEFYRIEAIFNTLSKSLMAGGVVFFVFGTKVTFLCCFLWSNLIFQHNVDLRNCPLYKLTLGKTYFDEHDSVTGANTLFGCAHVQCTWIIEIL